MASLPIQEDKMPIQTSTETVRYSVEMSHDAANWWPIVETDDEDYARLRARTGDGLADRHSRIVRITTEVVEQFER